MGYWCGELEADTTLESDYIMVHTCWAPAIERKMQRARNEILRTQNDDGGWSIYRRRPVEYQCSRSKPISPSS